MRSTESKLAQEDSEYMESVSRKAAVRREFSEMLIEMFDYDNSKNQFDLDRPHRIALSIRRELDMAIAGRDSYRELIRDTLKGRL